MLEYDPRLQCAQQLANPERIQGKSCLYPNHSLRMDIDLAVACSNHPHGNSLRHSLRPGCRGSILFMVLGRPAFYAAIAGTQSTF